MSVAVLDRKLYTVPEAARLLRVHPSTLRWWLEGQGGRPPVIRLAPTGSSEVTWGEFVEAGFLRQYRKKRVPLQRVRLFIDALRRALDVPYPLAHRRPFVGPGRRLMLEAQGEAGLDSRPIVVAVPDGQLMLDGLVEEYVDRIDFAVESNGGAWAERLHPAGRDSPVVIDPTRSFGAATIAGIRTEVLVEHVQAGEPVSEVAVSYGLSVEDVQAAVSFEWAAAA